MSHVLIKLNSCAHLVLRYHRGAITHTKLKTEFVEILSSEAVYTLVSYSSSRINALRLVSETYSAPASRALNKAALSTATVGILTSSRHKADEYSARGIQEKGIILKIPGIRLTSARRRVYSSCYSESELLGKWVFEIKFMRHKSHQPLTIHL